MARRPKPEPGDVYELQTSRGLAYAQFVFRSEAWQTQGEWLRLLPGLYPERPTELCELVALPERYLFNNFLDNSIQAKDLVWVAHCAVPAGANRHPLVKRTPRVFPSGEVDKRWTLFDGTQEWEVNPLPADCYRLPSCGKASPALVQERVETGWSPEDDVALYGGPRIDGPRASGRPTQRVSGPRTAQHFLSGSPAVARELMRQLEAGAWNAEAHQAPGDEVTSVIVTTVVPVERLSADTEALEGIAARVGAVYTGHEVEVG